MKSHNSNERLEVRRSFYLGITVPSARDTTTYSKDIYKFEIHGEQPFISEPPSEKKSIRAKTL